MPGHDTVTRTILLWEGDNMIRYARPMLTALAVVAVASMGGCNAKRKTFLSTMNPAALLAACRETLALVAKGDLKPGSYEFARPPVDPAIQRFPQAIRSLRPTRVVVHEEGYLSVEMAGGFDHFGVIAYPENFKQPYASFHYGDRKIVDGLWYYDDDYIDNPSYDKKVDKWMRKQKTGE